MKKHKSEDSLLQAAIAIYQSKPFVTKLWMMMRGFDKDFLDKNWKKITTDHPHELNKKSNCSI